MAAVLGVAWVVVSDAKATRDDLVPTTVIVVKLVTGTAVAKSVALSIATRASHGAPGVRHM